MKRAIAGRLFVAVIMVLCARGATDAAGPAHAEQIVDGSKEDDQTVMVDDLFSHVIEMAEGAASADELQMLLENDLLVQTSELSPGADLMVSSINAGDCRLSPLLCIFKWHTPDLRCVYDCLGPLGTGGLTSRQLDQCDFLAGCILFENCLALCISLLPYHPQPVIWW
jgi:hypothetical protein